MPDWATALLSLDGIVATVLVIWRWFDRRKHERDYDELRARVDQLENPSRGTLGE